MQSLCLLSETSVARQLASSSAKRFNVRVALARRENLSSSFAIDDAGSKSP